MNDAHAGHEANEGTPSKTSKQSPQRYIGAITTWIPQKRYGFITELDGVGENHIFFHITSIVGAQVIEVGAQVEYIVSTFKNKPCARQVVILRGAR